MYQSPAFTRILAAAALLGAASRTSEAKGLEVHEWGTFTTLSSSDGRPLGGLYVDASRLPAFVEGVPFFNYDASTGWAPLSKLRNVTVKMETPVLYFYSPAGVDVDVKVGFHGGSISQWYPRCYACETNPSGAFVDFAGKPYEGHIAWKARVLPPDSQPAYSTTGSGLETGEWSAPRMVASNMLRGEGGEYERFLFYRGIGNFPNTVKMAFLDDTTFTVANEGDEDIPWLMVYDRDFGNTMPPAAVHYYGPLKARRILTLRRGPFPQYYGTESMAPMDSLLAQLQIAGLKRDEALALQQTWYNGYFIEAGMKAFWILPRAMVDRILPIDIEPAPEALVRVIVGRSEILTPPFERELRKARDADSLSRYANDKYRLAYQEFLSPGRDAGGASLRPRPPLRAAANPSAPGPGPRFRWIASGPRDALGRFSP